MNADIFTPPVPPKGESLHWQGLQGDALPLAITRAAYEASGPLVVMTPDMHSAELLHELRLDF